MGFAKSEKQFAIFAIMLIAAPLSQRINADAETGKMSGTMLFAEKSRLAPIISLVYFGFFIKNAIKRMPQKPMAKFFIEIFDVISYHL